MRSACSSTASSDTTCAKSSPTFAPARKLRPRPADIKSSSAPPSSWRPPRRKLGQAGGISRIRSSEGALAHYSASVGVDFSRYGPDEPIRFVKTNAVRSNLEAITIRSRDNEWTLRKLLKMMVLGSRQSPIVGSPTRVADEMQAWVEEADVDGFNLSRTVVPECVEDFVTLVVPELQTRGLMKQGYAHGTLRKAVRAGTCPPAGQPPGSPPSALIIRSTCDLLHSIGAFRRANSWCRLGAAPTPAPPWLGPWPRSTRKPSLWRPGRPRRPGRLFSGHAPDRCPKS